MKPLSSSNPHLIIMVGIPGAGKSFFAEHFADTFKAPIVSFNKLRKTIFPEPSFSKPEDDLINQISNYMLDELLKVKQSILYEGPTSTRVERISIAKKARDAGFEPLFIWVQIEPATAKKRSIKVSPDNQMLNSDQFDIRLKRFVPPVPTEKVIVISGKHTYASQLKIVLKNLVEPHVTAVEQTSAMRQPRGRSFLIR